jgi:CubicO group peptidase (beta-lactamase class C family)
VHDAVLAPAGMERTGFRPLPDAARAVGYARAPRLADPLLRRLLPPGIAGPRHGDLLALNPFLVDGPAYGGLVGDVLDAARFLRLHLNDGTLDGVRILAADTARAMRRIDHPGRPFDHGLGWFRAPSSEPADHVEHFGAGAGYWNVLRLHPERGLGVVVLANTSRRYDVDTLLRTVLAAVEPRG